MNSAELFEAKVALRKEVLARLRTMTVEARRCGSELIHQRLQELPLWKAAEQVLLYASFGQEVDTWPLIRAALLAPKRVALPRYSVSERIYNACEIKDLPHDLAPGQLGILEPGKHCPNLELKHLDLVLVPGVAFDANCWRLGRGKGFYDRLLSTVSAVTCGVGFDEQIVAEVPVAPHDIQLNCILTPTRWLERTGRAAME